MQRSKIQALKQKHWFNPFETDPLEVCIIPSAYQRAWAVTNSAGEFTATQVCTDFFVEFKGYFDGDKPLENNLAYRLELFQGWPALRDEMFTEAGRLNSEAAQGEGSAASG